MKAYLFEHEVVGAGGSRYELYVPGLGILWPGFDRIITDSGNMAKMQKRVDKIHDWIRKGESNLREISGYNLIGEKDVPKHLLDDFVGWVESERISREGREESGKKLENLFKIKTEEISTEQVLENIDILSRMDLIAKAYE